MNKNELNEYAVQITKKAFEEQGYMLQESSLPKSIIDFIAVKGNRTMKIKVRAISQIGSYVFSLKRLFDVKDPDLYMAILYLPKFKMKLSYTLYLQSIGLEISIR